jgi:hypothetical protein
MEAIKKQKCYTRRVTAQHRQDYAAVYAMKGKNMRTRGQENLSFQGVLTSRCDQRLLRKNNALEIGKEIRLWVLDTKVRLCHWPIELPHSTHPWGAVNNQGFHPTGG